MSGLTTGLRTFIVFENLLFTDLYNYTGSTAFDHYCEYFEMGKNTNTAGGYIYDPLMFSGLSVGDLPLSPGEVIHANIDAPDLATSTWALAFAHNDSVHVRYFDTISNKEVILNNGTLGNFDISSFTNTDADIAYSPLGNRLHVAWVSDGFPAFPMLTTRTDKSIIGVEIDPNAPTPPAPPLTLGSSATLISYPDYLVVPYNADHPFGTKAMIALSKHADGLEGLYTSFGQEDDVAFYSIMHKLHQWSPVSSPSTWRQVQSGSTIETKNEQTEAELTIAPNPFSSVLTLRSADPQAVYQISICDIMGRTFYKRTGTVALLNTDLHYSNWPVGIYILQSTNTKGNTSSIKLIKE